MNKLYTKFNIFFLVVSIILILLFFLFFTINISEKNKIETLKNSIVEKATYNYFSVLELHLWHTSNDALYVKNSNVTKTNKYLSNNSIDINEQKLIRLGHAKLLKQFSRYSKEFNSFYYNLTSLNPINSKNKADSFETKGLKYLTHNPSERYFYENIDQALEKGTFDFIGELRIDNNCLKCHGAEGYKVGELKGGIRITTDTTTQNEAIEKIQQEFFNLKILTLMMGFLLIALVYWIIHYIFKQKAKLEYLNENLENLVKKRTNELNDFNKTLEIRIDKAIEKNKEQEELMIAQSRHAAMGEMINMIAHQWRQPIAVISMGANNILMDIELQEIDIDSFKDMADDIIDQTQYLTKTIDDFSNFFKQEKEKNSINPALVIEESISMISKSLENNGINLDKKLQETSEIETYSRELLQVLINLLKNAKEAIENIKTKTPLITIDLYEDETNIYIKVTDNGGGVPKEIQNKIFDPYFSTKKERTGTGLGLYMSKIIIEKHLYGKLNIENINDGAAFTITLPKGETTNELN